MALRLLAKVIGVEKVRKALERKTEEVNRAVELVLDESALNIQTDAKIDAPKDLGAAGIRGGGQTPADRPVASQGGGGKDNTCDVEVGAGPLAGSTTKGPKNRIFPPGQQAFRRCAYDSKPERSRRAAVDKFANRRNVRRP